MRIAAESDTLDWKPDNARAWAERVLPTLQRRRIVGVYAANDGTAGAAVVALHVAGLADVPVTGQDAETAALQRILAGQQYMTVYTRPSAPRPSSLRPAP